MAVTRVLLASFCVKKLSKYWWSEVLIIYNYSSQAKLISNDPSIGIGMRVVDSPLVTWYGTFGYWVLWWYTLLLTGMYFVKKKKKACWWIELCHLLCCKPLGGSVWTYLSYIAQLSLSLLSLSANLQQRLRVSAFTQVQFEVLALYLNIIILGSFMLSYLHSKGYDLLFILIHLSESRSYYLLWRKRFCIQNTSWWKWYT